MWQIALLAIPLIMSACNRNDSKSKSKPKPKPVESAPNPSETFDMEDTCSTDSPIIENTYSEFGKLKQLLDGNKYSIRGNEIFVDNASSEDISKIAEGNKFESGIHFSTEIQDSLNQLEGKDFYLCRKKNDSRPVSFYRFARHIGDLVIAKNLYKGLEINATFKASFPNDKVACSLKRDIITGPHDETGRLAHDPKQAHNIIQNKFDQCADLSNN